MPEGSTIIFILCGAGVLGLAGYWVAQDVAHRWQVRHHERSGGCCISRNRRRGSRW